MNASRTSKFLRLTRSIIMTDQLFNIHNKLTIEQYSAENLVSGKVSKIRERRIDIGRVR